MAEPPQITVWTLGRRLPLSFRYATVPIQMVGTPARIVAPSSSARPTTDFASPMNRSGKSTLLPAIPQA